MSAGILNEAQWIMVKRQGDQMPVFGRDIWLKEKPEKAEIAICGLGQFALFAGGKEVNAGICEPGWTNYRKTCLYSVYDLNDFLQKGENRIRVMLGNGMYHVSGNRYTKFKASFGNPMAIVSIRLRYADGSMETIVSDEQWRVCPGPVLFSCIYGGEDYDAGVRGWKESVTNEEAGWKPVEIYQGQIGVLKEAKYPPVRMNGILTPVSVRRLDEKRLLYDFGQNFAGCVSIRVNGKKGQRVVITPGELLKESGEINQAFTGSPHYYVYTLAGGEAENWTPRFTYYGLRYAMIETEAEVLDVSGVRQYADCPRTGSFSCSNEMYNQIHRIITEAIRSNIQSVFTDCPHREKLGWLEQTHLICGGILNNFDACALYEKILDDMEDAQTEDGMVPSICPEYVKFDMGFRDSPEWGSACILALWYLYLRYGKKELIERHYKTAQRYAAYLMSKCKNGILNYGLGDWLDVGHHAGHPANTPIPVTATAILYQDLTTMARMAEILGRTQEAEQYSEWAKQYRGSFNEAFYYALSGNYATGSQTANAMALFLEMHNKGEEKRVMKNLFADIKAHGGHFTGGDVGHPYILKALAKYGLNDIIAENLEKTDFPSYGYQVKCGATTLCEDWDGPNPEHPVMSQNHFMLGGAEEWFYESLAGIQVDASASEKIRIKPCFPKEVDWVDCSTLTPAGICRVQWKRMGNEIHLTVSLEKKEKVRICLGEKEELVEVERQIERKMRL